MGAAIGPPGCGAAPARWSCRPRAEIDPTRPRTRRTDASRRLENGRGPAEERPARRRRRRGRALAARSGVRKRPPPSTTEGLSLHRATRVRPKPAWLSDLPGSKHSLSSTDAHGVRRRRSRARCPSSCLGHRPGRSYATGLDPASARLPRDAPDWVGAGTPIIPRRFVAHPRAPLGHLCAARRLVPSRRDRWPELGGPQGVGAALKRVGARRAGAMKQCVRVLGGAFPRRATRGPLARALIVQYLIEAVNLRRITSLGAQPARQIETSRRYHHFFDDPESTRGAPWARTIRCARATGMARPASSERRLRAAAVPPALFWARARRFPTRTRSVSRAAAAAEGPTTSTRGALLQDDRGRTSLSAGRVPRPGGEL